MWRTLLIAGVAAAGLSLTVADVHAQNMDFGVRSGTNVNASTHSHGVTTHSRTVLHTRAQARGPEFTPRGWHHGRKVGWHCGNPPRPGCKPPGLR